MPMDLEIKQQNVRRGFNNAMDRLRAAEAAYEEAQAEVHRIQGEARLLDALVEEQERDTAASGVATEGESGEQAGDGAVVSETTQPEATPKPGDQGAEQGSPTEGEIVGKQPPYKKAKLHPVDESGIPAEAQVVSGDDNGR